MFQISWMMVQYFLPQLGSVDVHVYLCRRDVLVTKHRLDSPQMSTSFQQMSGETMAKRMWADVFLNACLRSILLDVNKDADAAHVATSFGGDEDEILFARFHFDSLAGHKPGT